MTNIYFSGGLSIRGNHHCTRPVGLNATINFMVEITNSVSLLTIREGTPASRRSTAPQMPTQQGCTNWPTRRG